MEKVLACIFLAMIWFIFYLFCCIKKPNPFDRVSVFNPKTYSISPLSYTTQITLKEKSSPNTLYDAVFEAVYISPDLVDISIITYRPMNFGWYNFDAFLRRFNKIDLEYYELLSDEFTISGSYCRYLTIPRCTKRIGFLRNINYLETLTLPRDHFVPAYLNCGMDENDNRTITVENDFCILVPLSMLDIYRTNDQWASLIFKSKDGTIIENVFFGYKTQSD